MTVRGRCDDVFLPVWGWSRVIADLFLGGQNTQLVDKDTFQKTTTMICFALLLAEKRTWGGELLSANCCALQVMLNPEQSDHKWTNLDLAKDLVILGGQMRMLRQVKKELVVRDPSEWLRIEL